MVSALNRFIAKQKSPEIRFTNLFAYFSGWPVCKLFGLFMLIAGPVCLLLTPPFQVADESNHFMRAIQISQNQPIAITRTPNEKGAFVPIPLFRSSRSSAR